MDLNYLTKNTQNLYFVRLAHIDFHSMLKDMEDSNGMAATYKMRLQKKNLELEGKIKDLNKTNNDLTIKVEEREKLIQMKNVKITAQKSEIDQLKSKVEREKKVWPV